MANKKKKIVFIINPISGTSEKHHLPNLIYDHIDTEAFDIEIKFTQYAGHAHKIAKECVDENVHIVVAAGGDGTINEVGSALVNSDTALSIVPLGSGNGLARHLDIPLNTVDALRSINHSNYTTIDYGIADDHIFFCTCGVGFDAHIGEVFSKQKTRGFFSYFKSVVTEFAKYTPKKYTLITEGSKIKRRAFLITIANASQYGNNAYIAPNANIQDGYLDVSILEPFPLYSIPFIGLKLFSRNIDKSIFIQILKTNKLTLKRKKKGIFHYDGEPVELGKKIEIEIKPRGLKVWIPTAQNIVKFF